MSSSRRPVRCTAGLSVGALARLWQSAYLSVLQLDDAGAPEQGY